MLEQNTILPSEKHLIFQLNILGWTNADVFVVQEGPKIPLMCFKHHKLL